MIYRFSGGVTEEANCNIVLTEQYKTPHGMMTRCSDVVLADDAGVQ